MKTTLSLKRHGYLKTIGVFLIAVALIAGIVSCEPGATYELTMAANPTDGGTATDETGTGPYSALEVVDIKAVPADCHQFVNWEATAGVIGNSTATETTFIMPAQDVTVTANFKKSSDHYMFYEVGGETVPIGEQVQLVDQFGAINATVGNAEYFGNPVEKVHDDILTPIKDENRHYTLYELLYEEEPQSWNVTVDNQFGNGQVLTVGGPVALAVPTQKEDHEKGECIDHLLVYEVIQTTSWLQEPIADVELNDQFLDELMVEVWDPAYFANPVQKTAPGSVPTPIEDPDLHYVYYPIYHVPSEPVEKRVQIDNQFGNQTLDLTYWEFLAVPSQKIGWYQPLNHFKGWWAEWADEPPMYEVPVLLEDQFVTINATVLDPYLFANPAAKSYGGGVGTPIYDPRNHLTFYWIGDYGEPQIWEVRVDNQFGKDQLLLVGGPFWLAVPTTKADHGEPVKLNHFLVYEVLDYDYEYGEVEVHLWDQIYGRWVWVYEPALFANPVQKTHGSETTDIKGDEHLVFYWITGDDFFISDLPVKNQFGPQLLYIYEGYECECEWNGYDILGVPSQKMEWDPFEP